MLAVGWWLGGADGLRAFWGQRVKAAAALVADEGVDTEEGEEAFIGKAVASFNLGRAASGTGFHTDWTSYKYARPFL